MSTASIAFHPSVGAYGVFRISTAHAESFTVAKIVNVIDRQIVTDGGHGFTPLDMIYCGDLESAASLTCNVNDLALSLRHCKAEIRQAFMRDIAGLEAEIEHMRARLGKEIARVEATFRADVRRFVEAAAGDLLCPEDDT